MTPTAKTAVKWTRGRKNASVSFRQSSEGLVAKAVPPTAAPTTTTTTTTTIPIPSDDSSSSDTPAAALPVKRRKLRKGTFSCIECKRRKVRCRFAEGEAREVGDNDTGKACLSCQRHGATCIGQEYAAPSPSPRRSPDPQYNDINQRIAQVEALVGELVRRRVNEGHPSRDSVVGSSGSTVNTTEVARSPSYSTADQFDQELESILQQDAHCFSHWMHDRFMSANSPKFRARSRSRSQSKSRSPSLSPSASQAITRLTQSSGYLDMSNIDNMDLNLNTGSNDSTSFIDIHPKMQMSIQLQQLEQELIANRLLFPARAPIYTGPLEHRTLNKQLQSVLPTIDDALRIMNRGALFTLRRYRAFLAADTQSGHSTTHAHALSPLQKRDTDHPVLLARELIQLAVCLQMMHKDSNLSDLGFPDDVAPWETADRYFEVASNLVTSQDAMVSSQEGLESLLLTAFFMVNKGDLRAGWMTLRRALGIAQIIGLPPPSWHNQPLSLHFVWTRLLFSERFLSLMLGLPSSIVEDHYRSSLAPHAATTKVATAGDWSANIEHLAQDLERLHALIIPRIAARNERLNQLAHAPFVCANFDRARHIQVLHEDYRDTRDIDYAFRLASQSLPTKWWAIPDLLGADGTNSHMEWAEQIEETARLMAQAKHYHFLVLLHLPYLTDRRPGVLPAKPPQQSLSTVLDEDIDFAGAQGLKDENSKVNFREFGAAAASEAAPTRVADDIAFAFGINFKEPAERAGASATATMAATTDDKQPFSSPSPPSNSSSTLAATSPPTDAHTSTAPLGPPDTTFSRLGALGAAREVLSRFMVFRYCTSVIARCHAFDFEAFVAAMAILLTHMDAHARGRDNVIHYQRPSDLGAVDKAMVLMDELADITKEPVNRTRSDILRRLIAIEADAAAGGQYEVWTEEGTLGRGDGRLTTDTTSAVQTMSVPYFGTIHTRRLSGAGGSVTNTATDNEVFSHWSK
ncbi:hypothetical protein Sste5344_000987 [Sporothrix stenoceras]